MRDFQASGTRLFDWGASPPEYEWRKDANARHCVSERPQGRPGCGIRGSQRATEQSCSFGAGNRHWGKELKQGEKAPRSNTAYASPFEVYVMYIV